MPEIIDPVGRDGGIAKQLKTAGDDMFAHGAERELRRQRIAEAQRKSTELAAYQDAYRRGDALEMGAHAIGAGADGESVARYALARRAITSGGDYGDPYLATMALGAGIPFANTAAGSREVAARAPAASAAPLARQPLAVAPPPPLAPDVPLDAGPPRPAPDTGPLGTTPQDRVMKELAARRRREEPDSTDPAFINAQPAPL